MATAERQTSDIININQPINIKIQKNYEEENFTLKGDAPAVRPHSRQHKCVGGGRDNSLIQS